MKAKLLKWLLLLAACAIGRVASIAIDNEIEGTPQTTCFQNGLRIEFMTKNPFSGHIYVKGMYGNPQCNLNYTGQTKTVYLSIAYDDCIHFQERMPEPPGMSFMVEIVVQFHQHFTTKVDRGFIVTCIYRESMNTVTQNQLYQGNINLPEGASDAIPVTYLSYSPQMPRCRYEIRKGGPNGQLVTYARIGEKLFHKWECLAGPDGQFHGVLIHSCFVRDGRGNAIQLLDRRGCTLDQFAMQTPTYSMNLTEATVEVHAFKFADDLQISFSCSISMCLRMRNRCQGVTPPVCSPPGAPAAVGGSPGPAIGSPSPVPGDVTGAPVTGGAGYDASTLSPNPFSGAGPVVIPGTPPPSFIPSPGGYGGIPAQRPQPSNPQPVSDIPATVTQAGGYGGAAIAGLAGSVRLATPGLPLAPPRASADSLPILVPPAEFGTRRNRPGNNLPGGAHTSGGDSGGSSYELAAVQSNRKQALQDVFARNPTPADDFEIENTVTIDPLALLRSGGFDAFSNLNGSSNLEKLLDGVLNSLENQLNDRAAKRSTTIAATPPSATTARNIFEQVNVTGRGFWHVPPGASIAHFPKFRNSTSPPPPVLSAVAQKLALVATEQNTTEPEKKFEGQEPSGWGFINFNTELQNTGMINGGADQILSPVVPGGAVRYVRRDIPVANPHSAPERLRPTHRAGKRLSGSTPLPLRSEIDDQDDDFPHLDISADNFIVFDDKTSHLAEMWENESKSALTSPDDICLTQIAFAQIIVALAILFSTIVAFGIYLHRRYYRQKASQPYCDD